MGEMNRNGDFSIFYTIIENVKNVIKSIIIKKKDRNSFKNRSKGLFLARN
jgi:hypothetical protein